VARDDDGGFGFDPRRAGARARGGSRSGGATSFQDFMRTFGSDEETEPDKDFVPRLPGRATLAAYNEPKFQYGAGRPRYFRGDETDPGRLPPHNIAAIQRLMVDANLLNDPRWGFWDPESETAYRQVLREANAMGVDAETLLTTYADAAAMAEQEAKGPFQADPLVFQVHNEKDVQNAFRKAIVEHLGEGWTQEQINAAAASYRAEEIRVQRGAQEQMIARERQLYETGGTDIEEITQVDVPSPDVWIEEEARRRDMAGYQANEIGSSYAPTFFQALQSPV
jgi:hypothetical protein